MSPMKTSMALALGLLLLLLGASAAESAWYLIMPPTTTVEPSRGVKLLVVNEKAPWKSWEVLAPSPFATQRQCMDWSNSLRESAAKPSDGKLTEADRVYREEQVPMLRCVAGDDPRLR